MKPCSPTNLNKYEEIKLTKKKTNIKAKEDQTH